jgi:hypothetical protein
LVDDEEIEDVGDDAEDDSEEGVLTKVITLDSSYALARAAEILDYLDHKSRKAEDFDKCLAVADLWIAMGQTLGQEEEEEKESITGQRIGFHAELAEIGEPDE